jgi:hypothetical protein
MGPIRLAQPPADRRDGMPGFDKPGGEVGPNVAGSANNDDFHEQDGTGCCIDDRIIESMLIDGRLMIRIDSLSRPRTMRRHEDFNR